MTLLEWMQSKDYNPDKVAELLGCSPHAVKKWIRRERTPRPQTIGLIKKISRNAVGADEWLPAD